MIPLRNVLLSANGCLFIMIIWALAGDPATLKVLGALVVIYLVLDFFYLSLTYPRGTISRNRALFLRDASTAPLEPTPK
jgi:asparagine N-glycosylation enzyme membrane subunit Stt3